MRSPPLQESSIFARKPHHLPRQAQKLRTGLTVPRDGTGLVVILTQRLARLAIEEVHPGAGRADDRLVLVSGISGSSSNWCWTFIPVAGHVKTKWARAPA